MPAPDPFISELLPTDEIAVQRGGARVWISASNVRAVRVPELRAGAVSLASARAAVVTFSSPMPDANYQVFCFPQSVVTGAPGLYPTNKTANGFTVNVPTQMTLDVGYLAIGSS